MDEGQQMSLGTIFNPLHLNKKVVGFALIRQVFLPNRGFEPVIYDENLGGYHGVKR